MAEAGTRGDGASAGTGTRRPDRGGWRQVLLTALVALGVTYFGGTTVGIDGDSMLPSLRDGERVAVPRYETWLHRLGVGSWSRGDIVYFPDPSAANRGLCPLLCDWVIKRVIAVEGDTVAIAAGQVLVNGTPLEEAYLGDNWRGSANLSTQTVPAGHVFVLGDNRGPYGSRDSRSYGPVPAARVGGRAAFVVWPLFRRGEDGGWILNARGLAP